MPVTLNPGFCVLFTFNIAVRRNGRTKGGRLLRFLGVTSFEVAVTGSGDGNSRTLTVAVGPAWEGKRNIRTIEVAAASHRSFVLRGFAGVPFRLRLSPTGLRPGHHNAI